MATWLSTGAVLVSLTADVGVTAARVQGESAKIYKTKTTANVPRVHVAVFLFAPVDGSAKCKSITIPRHQEAKRNDEVLWDVVNLSCADGVIVEIGGVDLAKAMGPVDNSDPKTKKGTVKRDAQLRTYKYSVTLDHGAFVEDPDLEIWHP